MIYSQQNNTQGDTQEQNLTGSHHILRRENFVERYRRKNREGNVPFVLKEMAVVSLSPPHPPFTTLILDLSLFLGKTDCFLIIRLLNDFTVFSHLTETRRVYKQDITLGITGQLCTTSDSSLNSRKKKNMRFRLA